MKLTFPWFAFYASDRKYLPIRTQGSTQKHFPFPLKLTSYNVPLLEKAVNLLSI